MPLGLPLDDYCPWDQTMYKSCDVNFFVLFIALTSVFGAILVIAIFIGVCCCIKCHRKPTVAMEGIGMASINDETLEKRESRNDARESRYNQIRAKYGLSSSNKYDKLENE